MAFTGLLGNSDSLLGQIRLAFPAPPPDVVINSTSYGSGTYGQGPFGGTSFDTTGPTLASISPADNADLVLPTAPLTFTITDPAEFDQFTLSLTVNGIQIIVGGDFVNASYGGSIVFNGQQLDVAVGSHPDWQGGVNAVAISVTDLAGISQTFNTTFVMGVYDVVTVADAVTVQATLFTAGVNDTVTVSDASIEQRGLVLPISDTAIAVVDAVSPHLGKGVGVADTVSLTDAATSRLGAHQNAPDIVTVTDTAHPSGNQALPVADTVLISDALSIRAHYPLPLPPEPHIGVSDSVSAGSINIVTNGTVLTMAFAVGLRIDGITDLANYTIAPLGPHESPPGNNAFPVNILGVAPLQTTLQSGALAAIVSCDGSSTIVSLPDSSPLTIDDLGTYLSLFGKYNAADNMRIIEIVDPTTVKVNRPLITTDPTSGSIPWTRLSSVGGVTVITSKFTNGGLYTIVTQHLKTSSLGLPADVNTFFQAAAPKPKVVSAQALTDGQIIVTFSDPMLDNPVLTSASEYTFTGPTVARVTNVQTLSPTQVLLHTAGLGSGAYTLNVNASGTPHDSSGNPIDPLFNQAIFSTDIPEVVRSLFVDKGPITKPPLVFQSGATATVVDATTLTLPGGTLTSAQAGLLITLTGTTTNAGTYRITAVVSPTQVRVNASFRVPDPANGSIGWQVYDPRDGEIADDISDVVVRINGVPTPPQAVVGLLGQIVMATPPPHGADVRVDYHWMCNPVVDFRRMNSKEFRFNNWNRDLGRPNDLNRHKYRYNNTLVRPSTYVPLDVRAPLDQPLLRDMKYRAYERAYTAVFNDPNLLLFNSPTNRIAFPPLSRTVESVFINYQATVLPESDANPWTRLGTGLASILSNELVVQDNTTGPFPGGNPIYWTRQIDLTFPHVFAIAWRMTLNAYPTTQGIFTGVAAGYSDDQKAIVIGYLVDGGVTKLGILKAGSGNDPSTLAAWTGGLDSSGTPTGLPAELDTSLLHSYRLFRDRDGTIRVYVDGSVVELLRVTEAELPFLEELNDPFNTLQGVFFGSLSREAMNTSTWDFVRYNILPLNPFQSAPSIFVSYEGTTSPETASDPWTPVGFHGTESIISNDYLLLDSTSATDLPTEGAAGLVSGDFKGFVRIEPLLQVASDVVLDVNVAIRTFTHGITPNAVLAAVDDGSKLLQLCFLSDTAAPKFSYGGRSFPDQFSPYVWSKLGGATPTMVGQYLRITDTTVSDGLVYFINDNTPFLDPQRVVGYSNDYMFEFRVRVLAHTADVLGFAGVSVDVYDSQRDVGVFFQDISGTKYVSFHSDGVLVAGGQFVFNWDDGAFHTFRAVKSTIGNLVTLFADGQMLGSVAYTAFSIPLPSPVGVLTFGTSTPTSVQAISTTEWAYCNAWRVNDPTLIGHYVGIWKGSDPNALTGYHLPLKAEGRAALVVGNALGDGAANFVAAGVVPGDYLVIDSGPNKGVYPIQSVAANSLTIPTLFTVQPSKVDYRIPARTDWTVQHRYRIVRDPGGGVALLLDTIAQPLIQLVYDTTELPSSSVGTPTILAGGMPSIVFGAFDPQNLSQTSWDYVRFGITRPLSERGIVPHHQVLNQRNVIASYEHHQTNIPHTHTDFWSESEGIPPQTDPDFLKNPLLTAYTQLNDRTPLVPSTQTYEVRRPTPVLVSVAAFNNPEDLLNSQGFLMNESATEIKLLVPEDVLYDSIQIIETDTGSPDLIAPFDDECEPHDLGVFSFQNEVCLTYDGDVLPENDPNAITPWTFQATNPSHVNRSAFASILTYGTDSTGTTTIYRNNTPLPDQIALGTEVKFRLKVLSDGSGGLGDSQIRFGFSSPGLTMALAFVTTPLGQRYVLVYDLNAMKVVGGIPFDFYDGNFHVYRLVRDVQSASVQVFVDS